MWACRDFETCNSRHVYERQRISSAAWELYVSRENDKQHINCTICIPDDTEYHHRRAKELNSTIVGGRVTNSTLRSAKRRGEEEESAQIPFHQENKILKFSIVPQKRECLWYQIHRSNFATFSSRPSSGSKRKNNNHMTKTKENFF